MQDVLPWLPSMFALLGAAAAWGSTREQLTALRSQLDDHRRDATGRDASAQTKLDTLLSRHTELASRVAVLERDVTHRSDRSTEADTTLRAHLDALTDRVHDLERNTVGPRPSPTHSPR